MTYRPLVVLLVVATPAWAGGAALDLRSEKEFSNNIDGHLCKQLFVKNREVAWVVDAVETSVGLVARICKEEAPSHEGAAEPGTTYGGVLDGWYVVDLTTGKTSQLMLPRLGNFSNPTFCGRWAAYWGISEGSSYSLVIASLQRKNVLKSVSVGTLQLETDYMYHLAPATWSANCKSATFKDERYIKTTVIDAKSN